MKSNKMSTEMQYVERNGCCLNIEEKMMLDLALRELKNDLGHSNVWFFGKVSGK